MLAYIPYMDPMGIEPSKIIQHIRTSFRDGDFYATRSAQPSLSTSYVKKFASSPCWPWINHDQSL